MVKPIERMLALFPHAKRGANGWYEDKCPAHDDQHASFGFYEKPDGTVVVKCQAGCMRGDILTALGLQSQELYPDAPGQSDDRPKVVAAYDYRDKDGTVLYQTVRREPGANGRKKDYRQRQPRRPGMDLTKKDGGKRYCDDHWVWDLQDIHPVLYRLPQVLEAVKAGRTIYLAEGEPPAEALVRMGLDGTTAPLGAGNWRHHYAKSIAGADVVCLPDNDDTGRSHMQEAAASLKREGCRVRILELPDLPVHGDAVEFERDGGTRERIETLSAERFRPAVADEEVPDEDDSGYHCSHIGNAERLVAKCGEQFRYCFSLSRFIVFDGRRWTTDDAFEVEGMAHQVVRAIPREVESVRAGAARKALLDHAAKSESDSAIGAMLRRCRPLPGVTVNATRFDLDPWLLNCQNGTLNLRTGDLRAHNADDHLMKLVPVAFDPDAECPEWLRFLDTVMQGNQALITFLHRAFGYSLTGIARERCVFILHGRGRNGKSCTLNVLRRITGEYAVRTPTSTLMLQSNRGIPNDVARLVGKHVVTASETKEERAEDMTLDEAMIKDVTGGEPITARFLHKEWFEFLPAFKLWLGTNHIPIIHGTDDAIWDRIRLVPFNQRFWIEGETPGLDDLPADDTVQDALYAEEEGILAWAVRGCLAWQESGLTYPQEVRRAVLAYRADMDALLRFVESRCVRGKFAHVGAAALYEAYCAWCKGEDILPESQKKLATRLSQRGFTREHTMSGASWFGLELAKKAGQTEGEFTEYEPGSDVEGLFLGEGA